MFVTLGGHQLQRRQAIEADLKETWGFDDVREHEGMLTASADNWLAGGEAEEQFAERLARVIWQANDAYCQVQVEATCLEDLPCEEYIFDEANYRQLHANRW